MIDNRLCSAEEFTSSANPTVTIGLTALEQDPRPEEVILHTKPISKLLLFLPLSFRAGRVLVLVLVLVLAPVRQNVPSAPPCRRTQLQAYGRRQKKSSDCVGPRPIKTCLFPQSVKARHVNFYPIRPNQAPQYKYTLVPAQGEGAKTEEINSSRETQHARRKSRVNQRPLTRFPCTKSSIFPPSPLNNV